VSERVTERKRATETAREKGEREEGKREKERERGR